MGRRSTGTLRRQLEALRTEIEALPRPPADDHQARLERGLDVMPLSARLALLEAVRRAKAEGGRAFDHLPDGLRGPFGHALQHGEWVGEPDPPPPPPTSTPTPTPTLAATPPPAAPESPPSPPPERPGYQIRLPDGFEEVL